VLAVERAPTPLVAHCAAIAKKYKVKIGAVYAQRSALDEPGRKGPTSKRPVDTVVPLAKALGVTVQKYWPDDYALMTADIKKSGLQAVVICWEHDALTNVAAQFGAKLTWPEGRYDVTFSVKLGSTALSTDFQNVLPGDMNKAGPVPASTFIVACDHQKKASAKTESDYKGWTKWFGGEYALQYGGVRTIVVQKGCGAESEKLAKYLDAKVVDKDMDKPDDLVKALSKHKRENGVVLVVAERLDIQALTAKMSVAASYPADGAGVTIHHIWEGAKAGKSISVKHK